MPQELPIRSRLTAAVNPGSPQTPFTKGVPLEQLLQQMLTPQHPTMPMRPPLAKMPDFGALERLIRMDAKHGGQKQDFAPGFGQQFTQQQNFEGQLPSVPTSDLVDASQQFGGGANPEAFRAMMKLIESRQSDDRARGPADPGKVEDKEESSRWNPFKTLTDALTGK